jgi:hypothetical protein
MVGAKNEHRVGLSPTQRDYATLAQSELIHQKWDHVQSYLQLSTTKEILSGRNPTASVSFVSVPLPKLQLVLRGAESVLQVAKWS